MGIFGVEHTCNECKQQEKNGKQQAEHILFDCVDLGQVGSTNFGLVLKDGNILQKNIAGCILKYCRLEVSDSVDMTFTAWATSPWSCIVLVNDRSIQNNRLKLLLCTSANQYTFYT